MEQEALQFLRSVMLNEDADLELRVDAAEIIIMQANDAYNKEIDKYNSEVERHNA
jgi:hypothetical protein